MTPRVGAVLAALATAALLLAGCTAAPPGADPATDGATQDAGTDAHDAHHADAGRAAPGTG